MKTAWIALFLFGAALGANAQQSDPGSLEPLAFLQGTWTAKTEGKSAAAANGQYTFRLELGGHILARHSGTTDCKGPADYNCDHHDLFYVYNDGRGQPLQAIYFDNEGHVIHYVVSTPSPNIAVFESNFMPSGPRFRLMYTLNGTVMTGKFQMRLPSDSDWRSYLEWRGTRQ